MNSITIKGTLNNYGYCLKKHNISQQFIQDIKNHFIAQPQLKHVESPPFEIYYEDDAYIVLPKFTAGTTLSINNNIVEFTISKMKYKDKEINIEFTGKMRDYQMKIINSVLDKFQQNLDKKLPMGGIISLGCGGGKTVLAIYLAHVLQLKTLILVHKEFLMDQWIERIKSFTNASIGTIRSKTVDVNKDIIIGMVQSISMIDYDPEIFSDFGLVIYDEVHHLGSKVFSNCLMKTSAQYTIGLSATPERSDGMITIVKQFIGDILYKMVQKKKYKTHVKKLYFNSTSDLFKEKKRWFQGMPRPSHNVMTNNIIQIETRNNLIINIIDRLKTMGRKILILSTRIEHLETLKKGVDEIIKNDNEEHIYNTYFYVGKTKKGQKKMAETDGDIIFGTKQLAEEGLDIPHLNTIILATPEKNDKTLSQIIGRIMRKDEINEMNDLPLVIDISDELSIYKTFSKKRDFFYKKQDYVVDNYYYNDDKYMFDNNQDNTRDPMYYIFKDIEDGE